MREVHDNHTSKEKGAFLSQFAAEYRVFPQSVVLFSGGDLFWDDYDLCFPIADLYEGRI